MSATSGPDAASGATPPRDEGTRLSLAAVAGIVVVVLAAAGVGGYLIGHNKGESSGDSKGYASGVAAGKAQVSAEYQPGKPGYQRIYAAGQAAGVQQGKKAGEQQGQAQGKKVGFEQGQRQGITTGDSEGVRQGAAAVLGGFDTWSDGSYYVITMEAGTSEDVAYTIDTRTQLQPGTNYRICQSGGATQLCESPVAASASTAGGNANADDNGGAP